MPERKFTIIAAMDRNRLIGNHNRMPWNIPEDLAFFRAQTLDHTVIMGKNTWLSLGRALDRRTNIIMTHDTSFHIPGTIVCHSVDDCLEHCTFEECFVIGGAQIFSLFLPIASKLLITYIDAEFIGDTWFPEINPDEWTILSLESVKSSTGYNLSFTKYIRCSSLGRP